MFNFVLKKYLIEPEFQIREAKMVSRVRSWYELLYEDRIPKSLKILHLGDSSLFLCYGCPQQSREPMNVF